MKITISQTVRMQWDNREFTCSTDDPIRIIKKNGDEIFGTVSGIHTSCISLRYKHIDRVVCYDDILNIEFFEMPESQ